MTTKQKARYFTFILYPESMPEDWLMKLETLDIAMAISPLHNKDKSKDGGYKKPHYHVMYVAKNPVTTEAVRNRIKRNLGNDSISYVEIIDGMRNIYDYLTHESKDAIAKKKYKYDKKDIVTINGFDIDRYVTLDESEKRELKNLLLKIIRQNHLVNVIHLLDFIELHGAEYGVSNLNDVNDIVTSNASGFRLYFDANYQDGFRRKMIDEETGEIK